MPALNRVQLIGYLGKDPETRTTPTGRKVSHFSMGVNRHWKTETGETKEATDWVNIEAWGKLGEVCQDYLKKGRLVYLEGRLQTDRYEDKGETKFYTKVVASRMQILEKKQAGEPEEPELAVEEEPAEYLA